MIGLATTLVRAELDATDVVAVIRRVVVDGEATGRRAPLAGLEVGGRLVATSGRVRVGGRPYVGARLYHAVTPDDPDSGEITLLFDDDTGELLATATGCDLGEMRNGALGALAAARCTAARRPVVAVVGAGRQAAAQCEYLPTAVDAAALQVAGRDPERVHRLVERLGEGGVAARPCRCVEEAVVGADVVVTATSSTTPVLDAGWLRPGVHVTHVGTKKHGGSELPADVVAGADTVLVDSVPQFLADLDAGSLTHPFDGAGVRGLGDALSSDDDLGSRTTLYVCNGLPGGEVALLAAWLLRREGDALWR